MKKVSHYVVFTFLCIFAFILGNQTSKAYTTKTARGYYISSSPSGIASNSKTIIDSAGIGYTTSTAIADPSVYIFKNAMNSHEAIFVHMHGAPGLVQLQASGYCLYGTTVSSWTSGCLSSRLVYLSSCQVGTVSATYGDFPALLCQKGVGTVISFKQNIAASTYTNGIHRFNELAVTNMVNGYPVSQSMSLAKATFIAECNAAGTGYYGADSYRITGYGDYMLRHL